MLRAPQQLAKRFKSRIEFVPSLIARVPLRPSVGMQVDEARANIRQGFMHGRPDSSQPKLQVTLQINLGFSSVGRLSVIDCSEFFDGSYWLGHNSLITSIVPTVARGHSHALCEAGGRWQLAKMHGSSPPLHIRAAHGRLACFRFHPDPSCCPCTCTYMLRVPILETPVGSTAASDMAARHREVVRCGERREGSKAV